MRVAELIEVLRDRNPEDEVRIGDQLEAGPYEHYPVGGVYKGTHREVILCSNPDARSTEEPTGTDHDLLVLWRP
jgi:hypothetical protein